MIPSIHPFPARMAPELALESLRELRSSSFVLDPMAGSGTVLRHAEELGHHALGFDTDPLAVLMSRVWTTPVSDEIVCSVADKVISRARSLKPANIFLDWIDGDIETTEFVRYWFGLRQRRDLRRIAFALSELNARLRADEQRAAADLLRVALSRIVITKDQGASLGRDISHSRPHRVADRSDYDVFLNFERSISFVRNRMSQNAPTNRAHIALGDSRDLSSVGTRTVDAVVTSPPYLNAIDYMRGHRLSLVWLGHSLGTLRQIRSDSIGAECGADLVPEHDAHLAAMKAAMGPIEKLPPRHQRMINRYVRDLYRMVAEVARVLRRGGCAVFVMGNSCQKNVFILNSQAVAEAAKRVGLQLVKKRGRILPTRSRYLPIADKGMLGKRIRTEVILTFEKA